MPSFVPRVHSVVFRLNLILSFVLICPPSLVSGQFLFKEANARVGKELKLDRPCNFKLGINDTYLSTPAIVEKYGYPVERHWVTTEDHYILELHRIPKAPGSNGRPRPAIFLMHGVLSSSRDFVINCERRALAFLLWDNGYDVWMGNFRGNTYSCNHTVLNPDNYKFWDFSLDEVGFYDGPAMIDYILEATKVKQVTYVGHSMGNGVAMIMLSTRPEYNDKINFWFGMAAAITLQGTSSPLLRIIATVPRTFEYLLMRHNRGNFLPPLLIKFFRRTFPNMCRREGRDGDYHGICATMIFLSDGYDPGQVPPEFMSILAGGYPTTTSAKFMIQWMQWIISGDFAMYDEGPLQNLAKYGSVKPKLFDIENMNTSLLLFYGENDWIVDASDIRKMEELVRQLRPEDPPVEFFLVKNPQWNHIDFVFGKDADIYVYSHILKKLRTIYQDDEDVTVTRQ